MVKCYVPTSSHGGMAEITDAGGYVEYADYESLEAKLREARGLVDKWRAVENPPDYEDAKGRLIFCDDELAAILGANDA